MSAHNLVVGENIEAVWFSQEEAELLYDALVPVLSESIGGDYADRSEAWFMMKFISLTDLSANDFNLAYSLIMKMDNLRPETKDEIKKAFESDARLKSAQ